MLMLFILVGTAFAGPITKIPVTVPEQVRKADVLVPFDRPLITPQDATDQGPLTFSNVDGHIWQDSGEISFFQRWNLENQRPNKFTDGLLLSTWSGGGWLSDDAPRSFGGNQKGKCGENPIGSLKSRTGGNHNTLTSSFDMGDTTCVLPEVAMSAFIAAPTAPGEVPEPWTNALVGSGLVGMVALLRWRRGRPIPIVARSGPNRFQYHRRHERHR